MELKREVEKFDRLPADHEAPYIKHFHHGHKGILTTNEQRIDPQKVTTYKDDYLNIDNYDPNSEAKGIRYKMTEQMLTRKLLDQMDKEEGLNNDYYDEPTNYTSEAHGQFDVPGFVSKPPQPIGVR